MSVKFLVQGFRQDAEHWVREMNQMGFEVRPRDVASTSEGDRPLRGLSYAPALIRTGRSQGLNTPHWFAMDEWERLSCLFGETKVADFLPNGRLSYARGGDVHPVAPPMPARRDSLALAWERSGPTAESIVRAYDRLPEPERAKVWRHVSHNAYGRKGTKWVCMACGMEPGSEHDGVKARM